MIQQFQMYLNKSRKTNGDTLVPSTIERYLMFVAPYFDELQAIKDVSQLIDCMNIYIKMRNNSILVAAFRQYLGFRGFDILNKNGVHSKLRNVEKSANAHNSIRFIQSKVMSRGELKRVMNGLDSDPQLQLAISALYDSAARRAELMNIKYSDIEFMTKENKEELADGIYAKVEILGKGRKSRVVYFGRTTVKLIHTLTKGKFSNDDYLIRFVKDEKNNIFYKSQEHELYKRILKVHEQLLDRHVHPHCYRHTKLTHLADEGAPILEISAYAGHSSVQVTQIYIKISQFVGRRAFKYSKDIMQ